MPDEVLPGQRARQATAMIRRYESVQNDPEKEAAVGMLNQVYPGIRFRHLPSEGLVVFYLRGSPRQLPLGVAHRVSVILEIQPTGEALVLKHPSLTRGLRAPARDLFHELTGVAPAGIKSRWVMLEEDWI